MVRPRLPRSCSFRGLLAIVLLGAAGRCFMALQVRPYQQECIDKAIQENMVVSLKTGAGKTLVAVKVIDHFLEKEERHVLFVVPTKALVSQQAKYCQTHCQASPPAAELCGMEMERWDKGCWDECLRKNRLLVGTPEVFRRALDQGYLRAEQLSLIVLDECHQARGESPMANLMRLVSNAKEKPQPRVLGLTASFFWGNLKRKRDAEKAKMEMELLLGAGFLAPEVSEDAHHQSTDYEEVHWRASSYGANFESEIQPGLSRMAETLGDGADVKDFQRLGLRMNHVFKQLGRNALSSYTQHCIVPHFREKANTVMMAETVSEEERRYHKSVLERLPDLKNWARTFHPELLKLESVRSAPEISPKVDRLLQLLEQEPLKGQKGIVFVEQVSCTVPLALTISQRLGIHAEAAYGQMSRQDLNKILDRFKENETKVVVSTNALEEGIDVDSCSWVVRFDRFNTTKDHIQGSGRARASKAKIFYFDNDPQEEVSKERAMEEVAKDSRKGLTDEERRKLTEQRMPRQPTVPGIYPYTEEGGHQIHLFNGKEIVMRWCQQVLGIGFSAEPFQTEPEIRFEIPTPEGFRTFGLAEVEQHWQKVQLQEIVPTERLKEFSPRQRTELRSFYAVAVWLRKQGFLDQHHEPVVKHLELAKASCPPKKPELLLKLDGRKFERPAQALDNQRVVNYKAALQELLQQKYQTPLNELLRYSASMEDGGWIAQVTVSAEKEFSQTSHVCRTKKEAEQEAAKLAYAAYTPSTT